MNRESVELGFWDHVNELRQRLLKAILGLVIGACVAYVYWKEIWHLMTWPLRHHGLKVSLIATSPMETFMTSLKMSFVAGVILASPWILWQAWRFVGPALFDREKKVFLPAFFLSLIMFLGGVSFCFTLVLPASLQFLATYTDGAIAQTWKQGEYSSFVTQFLLAFGIIFQLPVVSLVLSQLGLLRPSQMWSFFRYAVILIFLIAAFLTPGPDPVSQILLALPLCFLYILSIGLSAMVYRKKNKQE